MYLDKFSNMSIRKKFFIAVTLVCIMSLIIVSGISLTIAYNLVFSAAQSQIEMTSLRYSKEIDWWFARQAEILDDIRKDIEINAEYYDHKDRLAYFLARRAEMARGQVTDFYIGFADKRLVSGSGYQPQEGYDCTRREWYVEALKKGGIVYTRPYIDADTKKMIITISEPLIMNGQLVGVLAEDIPLDYLVNLVKEIKIADGSYAFLLDQDKNIITYPVASYLPSDRQTSRIDQIVGGRFKPLAGQIDSGSHSLIRLADYDGESKYFFLSKISTTQWILAFAIPVAAITDKLHTLLLGYVFSFIISTLIGIGIIFFMLKGMLRPVAHLTQVVKQFGEKRLAVRCNIQSQDEIGELGKSFNNMADLIHNYSMNLEQKVAERTQELNDKNIKIQDSIEYAKMIQQAILPEDREFGKVFQEHFVIWKPRDIVGGDFYWLRSFEDGSLLVVGDCTGHGVPGALMTMAVNAILDRIVEDMSHADPAYILEELSRLLNQSLHRGRMTENVQDGLDAGVLFIPRQGKILFAAAHLSLFIVKDGEPFEIKGQNLTVGAEFYRRGKCFENHEFDLCSDAYFYLATDGLKDQAGGEKGFPYGKKRLMAVLASIHQRPMGEQKEIIWKEYEKYMGSEVPRDDLTMIGFKL
jgi:serine phosphatase RsbU (regulator of sigma subunit)/HAMP domain-containing protein